MLEQLTLLEFLIAFLMGLAAGCFLLWGMMVGAFKNVEEIKYKIIEVEDHER